MRIGIIVCLLFVLTGCESISKQLKDSWSGQSSMTTCVFSQDVYESMRAREENTCDVLFWLEYWQQQSSTPWRERKPELAKLSDSIDDRLRRFLLSQPLDTPYQTRLGAQLVFAELREKLNPQYAELFYQIAYIPSQKLLEYESAITVLSQVNTRQQSQMKEQAQLLQEQAEKLNQLLKIEEAILEKSAER